MVSGAIDRWPGRHRRARAPLLPDDPGHLRQLGAAVRWPAPDRHPDPEPRRRGGHDVPQAAARRRRLRSRRASERPESTPRCRPRPQRWRRNHDSGAVRPRHLGLVRRRARRGRRRSRRRARPAGRPDRPERRRQDDASSTPSPGSCPIAERSASTGSDVTGSPPHVRARRGLARTWQATELFDDLTVRENLTVAARHPTMLADDQGALLQPGQRRRARSTRHSSVLALGDLAEAHCRPSSPRASARWWPSPEPCRRGRSCCCSTSRQPGSTRTNRSRSGTSCASRRPRDPDAARRPRHGAGARDLRSAGGGRVRAA